MFTQIKCPSCNGQKTVERNDHKGRRTDKEPCRDCNGAGVITLVRLIFLAKRYKDELCELECQLKKAEKK